MNLDAIAFYNLENLFDTIDDPRTGDDDFTPSGKKKWDSKRYQEKINKLAKAISGIGREETGQSPSILGLCEVENKYVIEDLINHKYLLNEGYEIVHFDSKDERGIDTAMIYKPSYFSLKEAKPLSVELTNEDGSVDYTRDVLQVLGEVNGQEIHFFVCHFPSKRNEDINKPKREKIANYLREKYVEVLTSGEEKLVVLLGDFNDSPSSHLMRNILKGEEEIHQVNETDLYNPMIGLKKGGEGSLNYKKEWFLFDQILLSQGFLAKNKPVEYKKSQVFSPKFLQEWEGDYAGNPFRTYAGKRHLGGSSDHFPVYVIVEKNT